MRNRLFRDRILEWTIRVVLKWDQQRKAECKERRELSLFFFLIKSPQNYKDFSTHRRQVSLLPCCSGRMFERSTQPVVFKKRSPAECKDTQELYIYSCPQNCKDFYPQEASLIIGFNVQVKLSHICVPQMVEEQTIGKTSVEKKRFLSGIARIT